MAKLDSAIDRLFRQPSTEFVLRTGHNPVLHTPGGPVPLLNQALTSQQIVALTAELAPPPIQAQLVSEGTVSFPYAAPGGRTLVRLARQGEQVTVVITPEPIASRTTPSPVGATTSTGIPGAATPAPRGRISSVPFHSVEHVSVRRAAEPLPPALVAPPPPPPVVVPPGVPTVAQRRIPPADPKGAMEFLLGVMLERRASDLHLAGGCAPVFRVDGDICREETLAPIPNERLKEMLWSIAPERNRQEWEATKDTDFAHELPESRFRVNVFSGRKGIGAVLRVIPNTIRTAEELGLSQHLLDLCGLTKGLVLVTGPTGSGKSTTLAAMIDYINRNRTDHIITIEDPIEFVHPDKSCIVTQREVVTHTEGFKRALRAALREDPDIVLVGELRDLETISIAIETAETGHLVFGTLHTNTAPSTVDRIIDQFPADRQSQVRTMLSESLKGVVSQTLVKKIGGGRAAALEVLISTSAVTNLIREGKTYQLPSLMQTGKSNGMATLNSALLDLVKRGVVDPKEAYAKAVAKSEFKAMVEAAGFKLTQDTPPPATGTTPVPAPANVRSPGGSTATG